MVTYSPTCSSYECVGVQLAYQQHVVQGNKLLHIAKEDADLSSCDRGGVNGRAIASL